MRLLHIDILFERLLQFKSQMF